MLEAVALLARSDRYRTQSRRYGASERRVPVLCRPRPSLSGSEPALCAVHQLCELLLAPEL